MMNASRSFDANIMAALDGEVAVPCTCNPL